MKLHLEGMVYAVFFQAQWTFGSIGLVSSTKIEKRYYVDNHEKETTIEYRWKFVNRYIAFERQSYWWVQLTLDEAQTYFSKLLVLKEAGYSYVDADKGVDVLEFHINDCEYFIYLIKGTHYGEFLSVMFTEGQIPVMNIGHDECIFKQYIFSPKSWKVPDGETLLVPKYEGIGIMISDFQSRNFDFGFSWDDLSDAYLNIINYFRSDKAYTNKDSAKLLQNGSALKKYMSREDNDFVVLFKYVNYDNKKGYWIYEHLVLQMEDYLERLKVLYLYYDFVFLFDHLCAHDWSHEGGLNSGITRKYFGVKQTNMRDTVILG